MPRVVFRCDASTVIGSGHVARCMALARALARRGATVELVSRDLPQRVRELLVEPAGVRVHDLGSPRHAANDEGEPLAHAEWLPVSQAADAGQTLDALEAGARVEWLIVDHYALDARWEHAVRPAAANLLVIDDLADRDHACDALLDQNFFRDAQRRYERRIVAGAELMLGPRYALLREEFAHARPATSVRDEVKRIFVCFGGFDPERQTQRALDALEAAGLGSVEVDVVISKDHPQRAAIEARCAREAPWRVHVDAADIAALMTRADLAIGASGIMNWERAALRLPALVASLAHNQHVVAHELARERACIYLGPTQAWGAQTLAGLLRGLAGTPALLAALSERAGELTDARGAERVAARLLPEPIALRRATAADCDALHRWRNAEENRRYAFDAREIPLPEHRRWFSRVTADERVALLIGERGGEPLGVLRYDLTGAAATVSVYLVPGTHGRGAGTALLRAGSRWMREHHPEVRRLDAHVLHDNPRSASAFTNAGYRLASHVYTCELPHD